MNIERLFREKFQHISVDGTSKLSKEYFNTNYAYKDIPALFTKAFQNWPIKEKWTINYLIEMFGNNKQEVSANNKFADLSLEEYLNRDFGDDNFYFMTQNHLNNRLRDDYELPDFLNCWYRNSDSPKIYLSWLYVGKKGTMTGLHQDVWMTSAWNYLVSGKKLWIFYPLPFNDMINKNKSQYDIQSLLQKTLSNENLDIDPIICIQSPGELVYTPSRFWHAVYNLDLTISLTENFLNETNYDFVTQFFKENKNEKSNSSLNQLILSNFNKLQKA